MNKHEINICTFATRLASLTLLICMGVAHADDPPEKKEKPKPTIEIDTLPDVEPGPAETDEIAGTVKNVELKGLRLVIYSKGGDVYYVQPTADDPYTDIGTDGSFSADIHGGERYAVLLVTDKFKAKAKISKIPPIGKDVLAVAKKKPPKKKKS